MALVKDYYDDQGVHIQIYDDAYAGKTEEELEEVRENARRVARKILLREALRKQGVTEEELELLAGW